ncbi:protein LYK5 [Cryptomeria japonica]|uniref:protein LYK5 n=1 Tax=Cryptomeria japonica TaxID=3369 RepID=UPI0027D9E575|nr:protein LYK5 [Cryptomeria japonica]
MASVRLRYVPVIFVILQAVSAQQAYEARNNLNCSNTQDINYGYECNGEASSCQAYAVYRSQTGYQTLANISTLLNANQSQMATINNFSHNQILEINTAVTVRVDCSCAGNYSQANASYSVQPNDSYFSIANNTYQGLTTCQALSQQNSVAPTAIQPGMKISVPLRCACPTKTQAENGTKYLLSYTVQFGNSLSTISELYNVTLQEIRDANGLTGNDIFPFTTLLMPLTSAPTSSPQSPPPPPPPPPPRTTSAPTGGGGSKTGQHIGIGVGVAAAAMVMALAAGACIVLKRRKKKAQELPEKVPDSTPSPSKAKNADLLAGMADMGHVLPQYKFEDLQSATENFSASNRITASVYRGLLGSDAAPVAIKQMTGDISQELNILKTLNHFNLVQLIGLCKSEGRFYLIYEYAEHGSLDHLLHGPRVDTGTSQSSSISSSICLSWKQRIQIALDVAHGLHYLHNYANPPYVHKDIKSSHILLDSNYRAKIANFGLAKSAGDYALTRHVVGTKGYMAPEYLSSGLVTPKLDVFSFGVVLLELMSGRGAVLEDNNGGFQAQLLWTEIGAVVGGSNPQESLKGFMDSSLRDTYPLDMALAVAQLAAKCVDRDLNGRPATMDIVLSLSKWLSAMLDADSFDSEAALPGL